MFTPSTKNFGIWREGHISSRYFAAKSTVFLNVSLFVCLFCSLIILVLMIGIRKKSYFLETEGPPLPISEKMEGLTQNDSSVVFALSVSPLKNSKLLALFDTGETFTLPDELALLKQFLQSRSRNVLFTATLTMNKSIKLGKVQLWLDKNVGLPSTRYVMDTFVSMGFDEFDFAYEIEKSRGRKIKSEMPCLDDECSKSRSSQ